MFIVYRDAGPFREFWGRYTIEGDATWVRPWLHAYPIVTVFDTWEAARSVAPATRAEILQIHSSQTEMRGSVEWHARLELHR